MSKTPSGDAVRIPHKTPVATLAEFGGHFQWAVGRAAATQTELTI